MYSIENGGQSILKKEEILPRITGRHATRIRLRKARLLKNRCKQVPTSLSVLQPAFGDFPSHNPRAQQVINDGSLPSLMTLY